MTNHIDVTTLRDWLDQGKPVTVVDVRSADARIEWSIPGSVHVDACADLRQGRPGRIDDRRGRSVLGPWLSSESGFIERLVSRLPDTPPNFVTIVEFNERGQLPIGDVTDLEAGAHRCAVS